MTDEKRQDSVKLLGCPFCGGQAKIMKKSHETYIVCSDCGCIFPISSHENVELWNKREELLSCPLCGEYAFKIIGSKDDESEVSIQCIGCDLQTKIFEKEEDAIWAWNNRI